MIFYRLKIKYNLFFLCFKADATRLVCIKGYIKMKSLLLSRPGTQRIYYDDSVYFFVLPQCKCNLLTSDVNDETKRKI